MTATDISKKTTVQLFKDDICWVDAQIPGQSAAIRWNVVLNFYKERKGKTYMTALMLDIFNSNQGKKIIKDAIREENGN